MTLCGLTQTLCHALYPLLHDVGHLPRCHGCLAVTDGTEARELLETAHEPRDGSDGLRVVVEEAPAPRAQVQEETLGEVGEGVVGVDRIEYAQEFVRLHFSGTALPNPHRGLRGVKGVPGELAPPRLETAALQKRLHHRHRDYDTDDLGAQVDEEVAQGGVRPDDERHPYDDDREEEKGASDEGSYHGLPPVGAALHAHHGY